jgi:hypothetical protein
MEQLKEHGKVVRGWLGVEIQEVTPDLAQSFNLPKPEGALVAETFPAHLRYSGSSIGYQFASVLGGGIAPFIATALFNRDPSGFLVAAYLAITALISLIAVRFVVDRHGGEADAALIATPIPE